MTNSFIYILIIIYRRHEKRTPFIITLIYLVCGYYEWIHEHTEISELLLNKNGTVLSGFGLTSTPLIGSSAQQTCL